MYVSFFLLFVFGVLCFLFIWGALALSASFDERGIESNCGHCPLDKGFGHEHDCVWPDCVGRDGD